MFYALVGGEGVMADTGTRSPDLIGGDTDPYPAAADNDAAPGLALRHCCGHHPSKIGVIVGRIVDQGTRI